MHWYLMVFFSNSVAFRVLCNPCLFTHSSRIKKMQWNIKTSHSMRSIFKGANALMLGGCLLSRFSLVFLLFLREAASCLSPKQAYIMTTGYHHRVYRVTGFLSSRPNRVFHPLTRKGELLLPRLSSKGVTHSLAGEGVGGTKFRRRDKHSGTLCQLQSLNDYHVQISEIQYNGEFSRQQKWRANTNVPCLCNFAGDCLPTAVQISDKKRQGLGPVTLA